MDTSIPALSNSCFNALKNICSRIESEITSDTELAQISRWQDELGRLRLWAANIGAHRTGQSSLEFRLKDSSHIRQQVTNLLLDLGRMFQEVEEVLDSLSNGQDSHMEMDDTSDDDYDTGEELTQLHSNIVTVISCLFQMSMLVRKPARHDFYTLPQSQEVLAFKPFDQAHVKEKYPEADERLLARLGLAITLRRQYLRYRERHHAKLKQGLEIGTEGSVAPTIMLSETVVTGVEPWHIDSQDAETVSERSQTSYASSMLASGPLVIPAPPKESFGGAPFECPYCFVVISVDRTSAWHRHVFQDLQPYICTVADCSTPHTLFSTRHEWVQHMRESHPREWTCNENGATTMVNELNQSSFCATCPLCKSNSRSENHFVRHLARHLQELALFVLPQDDADSDASDPLGRISSESSVSGTMLPILDPSNWHDEQQVHDRQFNTLNDERFEEIQQEQERRGSLEPWEGLGWQIRASRSEQPDDRRNVPSREPSGASRQPAVRLDDFFVDGTGIHPEVLQSKIHVYLGPEAYFKRSIHNGIEGYLVTSFLPLTRAQLDDLQSLSRLYENELRQRRRLRDRGLPYEASETYRSQDANFNYPDDTDMMNNDSYSPLPTAPSGSTWAQTPQRYRQPERDNREANNIGVAPAVPGFGFQFPNMPNGFQFPPGFVMPESAPAQPPPSGPPDSYQQQPRGYQQQPRGSSHFSTANLDAGSPYVQPPPSVAPDSYQQQPRGYQQQPRGSSHFSTANLDAESPYVTLPQSGVNRFLGGISGKGDPSGKKRQQ